MTHYGGYPGGDPRKFHPDPEMSSPEEMAAHAAACAAWNRGERPEPATVLNGSHEGHPFHAAVRPFGIGVIIDEVDDEAEEHEPDLSLEEQDDEELLGIYLSNAGQDSDDAMRILAARHGLSTTVEPSDDEEPDEEAAEG